ncbi:EAL domain-containing protein [Curvibacter sp. CHRR-16]|uniref:putative bifunctional diguanylate cyclase/phosphodiesterase n=1 Tax=Curvibacter sp. CHRR-16 TaxID=2835872 RepID=UPI001BDB0D21|nr:bifunctional diguanylate cyclase/phosphodiesterase [Curvibacter sp. CHRR-16]MBT0570092.1 EAL domain-containing protein [Curvibacter sp. CHRR-16]
MKQEPIPNPSTFGLLPQRTTDDAHTVISFTLDTQYRYVAFNQQHQEAMRALWGKEISLGMHMLDAVIGDHPDHGVAKRAFDRALGGESFSEESAYGDETKQREFWQTFYVPLHNEADQIIGLSCFVLNISERKRMQAELALREHEFRTLVEHATDTVVRYGPGLQRQYANPAFYRLLRLSPEQVIGKKPSDLAESVYADALEMNLHKVFQSGEPREFDMPIRLPDKQPQHMWICLTPEFGSQGQVQSVLAVGRDVTELHASRHQLKQMAFYDTLTTLPNRTLFMERLHENLSFALQHGQTGAVMMIDLDRFKEVNDSLGHTLGDELLRMVAIRLAGCARALDCVARLGGDEFVMVVAQVGTTDEVGRIANKILATLNAPYVLHGHEVFVSGSIGIALFPNDGSEPNDLLKYADSAMFLAKRSGRNAYRLYSKHLTEQANARLQLETELRRALERKAMALYFQPKIDLRTGQLVGSEALVRWQHPERGVITPYQFIPIAEDTGLIIPLGTWVLRQACHTASLWNRAGAPPHKVAINLSARQFQAGNLISTITQTLQETGCRPEWIELEITESLLLEEDKYIFNMLTQLRGMGISIAIDDFGTGYSALSYLARFPITTLKIDRSFTSQICADHSRAELVKGIISLAHALGQEVVAEGVEQAEQAAFLAQHGCQLAQGYLYSQPVPIDEFEKLPQQF